MLRNLVHVPLIVLIILISGCVTDTGPEEPKECEEGETVSCGTDVGICKTGIKICVNGSFSECIGSVDPITEICFNKLDDDCDGTIDDDCGECDENQTRSCGTDVGECQTGIERCVNRTWSDCVGSIEPTVEVCDGLDNDCDGDVDEIDCLEDESIFMEGQARTIVIEMTSYKVTLVGVSDPDTTIVMVNDETKKINKGEEKSVSGLGVYVAKITYFPKEAQVSWARLIFFS